MIFLLINILLSLFQTNNKFNFKFKKTCTNTSKKSPCCSLWQPQCSPSRPATRTMTTTEAAAPAPRHPLMSLNSSGNGALMMGSILISTSQSTPTTPVIGVITDASGHSVETYSTDRTPTMTKTTDGRLPFALISQSRASPTTQWSSKENARMRMAARATTPAPSTRCSNHFPPSLPRVPAPYAGTLFHPRTFKCYIKLNL